MCIAKHYIALCICFLVYLELCGFHKEATSLYTLRLGCCSLYLLCIHLVVKLIHRFNIMMPLLNRSRGVMAATSGKVRFRLVSFTVAVTLLSYLLFNPLSRICANQAFYYTFLAVSSCTVHVLL